MSAKDPAIIQLNHEGDRTPCILDNARDPWCTRAKVPDIRRPWSQTGYLVALNEHHVFFCAVPGLLRFFGWYLVSVGLGESSVDDLH